MNLYLSTLLAWAGLVVAIAVLVGICGCVCRVVAHEWKLRRVWRDEPNDSFASKKVLDRERA